MRSAGVVITAALCWYDEPPAILRRLIHSLTGLCDRLVAVDGGWELVDDAKPHSPTAQVSAIRDVARRANIQAVIHQPDKLWKGQVEKRDWMMREAAEGSDWVLVVDADYEIHCPNPHYVRRELRHTSADALRVNFHTPVPRGEYGPEVFAHEWHEKLAGVTKETALLFRALPGMRVEKRHWWYSAEKRGQRVALWGCGHLYPRGREKKLRSQLRIDHHCLTRDQALIDRNRLYIERRSEVLAATGFEP